MNDLFRTLHCRIPAGTVIAALYAWLLFGGIIACNDPASIEPPTVRQYGCLDDQTDYGFRIVRPNGAEVFTAGAPCTLVFTATRTMRAGFLIELGRNRFQLPGLDRSMDPMVDSMVIFTVPEYFIEQVYNQSTNDFDQIRISTISDSVRLLMTDYGDPSIYDATDCLFSIKAP